MALDKEVLAGWIPVLFDKVPMCASDRLARFASAALGSLRSRISNSLQVRKGGNRM